jgi:excisionase family DNA binding protein
MAGKLQTSKKSTASNGMPQGQEILTLQEAAAYLRVSTEDVVKMIDSEGLPARKFGTEWRFYKTAVQDWLSRPRKRNILDHVGEIAGDPYLEEMLRDIYKQRGRPEVPESEEV